MLLALVLCPEYQVHLFYPVNVKLLVEGSAVTYPDWSASLVTIQVSQLFLGNVCLTPDGEHDGQAAIGHARCEKALADKVHVGICFFGEPKSEKDVDGEAGVADPREPIVPVPDTANVFRDGECRGRDDGTSGFIGHQLQDHETARYDFAPPALVLALGDPVVPKRLGVVLLHVKNSICYDWREVVWGIVTENKRHTLSFGYVDDGNYALTKHTRPHDLLE